MACLPWAWARDFHAKRVRGGDNDFQLIVIHELQVGIVTDRHDPARRHDLDQVRAFALQPADRAARFVRAVDHGIARVRQFGDIGDQAVRGIAVPAGRPESLARHPHARTGHLPVRHRLFERDDGVSVVSHRPDRREAGQQRGPCIVHAIDQHIVTRLRDGTANGIALVAGDRNMDVHVDQARQHRPVRQIDQRVPLGDRCEAFAHFDNAITVHDDRDILPGRSAGSIDELSGTNDSMRGSPGGDQGHGAGQRQYRAVHLR